MLSTNKLFILHPVPYLMYHEPITHNIKLRGKETTRILNLIIEASTRKKYRHNRIPVCLVP
jgi:hypothetical protein